MSKTIKNELIPTSHEGAAAFHSNLKEIQIALGGSANIGLYLQWMSLHELIKIRELLEKQAKK